MVVRETLQHRTVMAESSGQYQSSPYDPSELFVEVVHPDRGRVVCRACSKNCYHHYVQYNYVVLHDIDMNVIISLQKMNSNSSLQVEQKPMGRPTDTNTVITDSIILLMLHDVLP